MRALVLVEEGVLKLQEIPKPEIKSGKALVRIKAAALNRRDQWLREGKYPRIKYQCILGSDGAGVVEDVGDENEKDWIGREVIINPNIDWGSNPDVQSKNYRILGMPDHGTFADYILIDTDRLCEMPDHLSFEEASAIPLGGLTAFRAVFTHGRLKHKDRVLISGFGGGVAQFAFQFAVKEGAETFVTSGKDTKIQKAVSMGAKNGFNYNNENWMESISKEISGFDLILDSAGGEQFNDLVKLLNPAGRLIFYGATNGIPSALDLYRIFWKQVTLQGSTMGNDLEFREMAEYISSQTIKPIINTYKIEDFQNAFKDMDTGELLGKAVLIL